MNVFCWMDGSIVTGYSQLRCEESQVEMTLEAAEAALACNQFDAIKAKKLADLNQLVEWGLLYLLDKYSGSEKLSFHDQKTEAYALKANPAASVPLLTDIAAGASLVVADLALSVRKNSAAYQKAIGIAIGEKKRCENLWNAMSSGTHTIADLNNVIPALPANFEAQVQAAYDAET